MAGGVTPTAAATARIDRADSSLVASRIRSAAARISARSWAPWPRGDRALRGGLTPGAGVDIPPIVNRLGLSAGPPAVAVGDRHPPVPAEGLGRDPHPGGHLASLVLGQVDQTHHLADQLGVEAGLDQLGGGQVVLDV